MEKANTMDSVHSSRRNVRNNLLSLVAAMIVLASSSQSTAALLAPGGILFPAPAGGLNGGTSLAVKNTAYVSATFTGTLHSEVFGSDPTNPFGLGGLTFVYQITNTSNFASQIERITIPDFSGFQTNADYVAGAGGFIAPTYVDRSVSPGVTPGFGFLPTPIGAGSIMSGQTSALLVIYTDARAFQSTTASIIDGSVTTTPSFAPSTVIPEPSSIVLAGFASVSLVWYLRRRRA